MLVSAVQQSESVICTHVSPSSWASLPPPTPTPRSSESMDLSSVSYSSLPLAICCTHSSVYMPVLLSICPTLSSLQKTKIIASGPITSWQIDGETMETVGDFILGGSRVTADGDCSHEIKRRLLLGRKVMTNLDSIFKSRDITLPTKVHLVKAMVFQVVMKECESWTIKKAERRRMDDFELWCWRRLLRIPWTARRSNQSILKEISPGCSLEGTDVEAETPKLWKPDAKNWLIWKDPDVGKDWRWEEKGTTEDEMVGWHHRLNGHEFE